MKKGHKISQMHVEYHWLAAEWYSSAYDHVRNYIPHLNNTTNGYLQHPSHLYYYLFSSPQAKYIQIILRMERGKLLSMLPKNIKWFEVELNIEELGKVQVICEETWYNEFLKTNKEYTVKQIAERVLLEIANNPDPEKWHWPLYHLRKIAEIYFNKKKHDFKEKLILLKSSHSNEISILEGNHRAIVFYMRYLVNQKKKPPTNFIMGISPNMQSYPFYNYKFWFKKGLK